jgi:phosphoribosylformylglycinamidine synthase
VIYRYSDESGNIVPAANLNGSFRNIAGICSKDRNVFGMMPHPERACSEALGNIDGQAILRALFIHAAAHTSKAAVANF